MATVEHSLFPVGWAVGLRRGLDWIVDTARKVGITQLQLSYLEELDNAEGIERIRQAIHAIGAEIVAITFGFIGEDWRDISSIYRTCGLVPIETRAERMKHFGRIARFAQRLGVRRLAGHVGHLPTTPADHRDLVDTLCALCGQLAEAGQVLSLETGQEPAEQMAHFIRAIEAPNLKVNFDPANFILYGNGTPTDAWEILQPWVDAIHCKDATSGKDRCYVGSEARLDEGEVGFSAWLRRVLNVGFDGPLIIETGVKGERLASDLLRARRLVQSIAMARPSIKTGTVSL